MKGLVKFTLSDTSRSSWSGTQSIENNKDKKSTSFVSHYKGNEKCWLHSSHESLQNVR